MDLPISLSNFFSEQKARYGELFWYEETVTGKIVVMLEKIAQQARDILNQSQVCDIEIVSFEADDSIGDFYLVDCSVLSVPTRPSNQEYFDLFEEKIAQGYVDWTNDIIQNQLVRVYRSEQIGFFALVVYHSFDMRAPRGPIGWVKSINGLRRISGKQFIYPDKLKTLESICAELENVVYRIGGESIERGFDCSGLVQKIVYETKGIWLPRKAMWQAMVCKKIELSETQSGDLMFFSKKGQEQIDHVALVYQAQAGRLPIVFHTQKSVGKALFQDLNTVDWLKESEIRMIGRVE